MNVADEQRTIQIGENLVLCMLNEIFGPSIHLLVLDLFLENPLVQMNLREVARRVEKNPGSIHRILPRLVEQGLLSQEKVGKVSYVYRLNSQSKLVELIERFVEELKSSI